MRVLLTFAAAWALTITAADAHPATGYEPYAPPSGYGQEGWRYGPEWDYNNLTFVRSYPDPSTLSNEERYMVFGSKDSSLGHPTPAWMTTIYNCACAYYIKYGELPVEMTPDVYRQMHSMGANETTDELESLLNPITNSYPRLDNTGSTPGALYMHVINPDELRHFAQLNPSFAALWTEGHGMMGDTYVEELPVPVIYYRLYGNNGVIANDIITSWVDTSGHYNGLPH